jgi:hypothetical protein
MTCDCNISVSYTQTLGQNSYFVGPIAVISETEFNGRPTYIWTDPMSSQEYRIYWSGEVWLIEFITEGTIILAELAEDTACPVGSTGLSNWEIQEFVPPSEYIIVELQTIAVCDDTTECTQWGTPGPSLIPEPWQYLIFAVDSLPSFAGPGTLIASISSVQPTILSPIGLSIGALVYIDDFDPEISYTTPGPNRTFIGIAIINSFGNFVSPTSYGIYDFNEGTICFENPNISTTDEINQECFDILVWNKQCEFAQCVLKYLRSLQFGSFSCEALDKLKNQKRALEILNCYDTRDIEFNSTTYNTLTYSQIKKLLNS